jgi:hypothetical protein
VNGPSDPNAPFQRDEMLDEPGISGARWWQTSLEREASAASAPARRDALKYILIGLGAVAGVAAVGSAAKSCLADDWEAQPRPALQMQRTYGWAFGAATESLVFNGRSTEPFDRTKLATLQTDTSPVRSSLQRLAVTTIFESPDAKPTQTAEGDPQSFTPLSSVLVPIHTPAMDVAYARGVALGELFASAQPDPDVTVIVDLPGPEAVAFAAGASMGLDPVLLFDNWPHPRGVVPAHLTLAALAYYQPRFSLTRGSRRPALNAMLVLDRKRLEPYTDESTQFDNRFFARLPSASTMKQTVKRVLYVTPTASAQELDDVNDDFVAYAREGIDVRMLAADELVIVPAKPGSDPTLPPDALYGGSKETHGAFWLTYPWSTAPAGVKSYAGPSALWKPKARTTGFSVAAAGKNAPPNFGTVPVIVAAETGAILGAKLSRSGSWTRSSGGWGG